MFLTEEDDKREPVAVLDDSFPNPDRSTVQLRQEDVVYLKSDQTLAKPRAARDLGVLLRISAVIHSIHKPSDLQKKVLEMVFDSVPATFGAFLTLNKDATDFTSVLTHDRSNDTTRRFTVTLGPDSSSKTTLYSHSCVAEICFIFNLISTLRSEPVLRATFPRS